MIQHEARFLGGPAEGQIRAVQQMRHEITFARVAPTGRPWFEAADDPLAPVSVEHHVYLPVRTVTYYEHQGVR